jgi:hypothetical protein
MENRTLIHVDLLTMNVSWTTNDLELVENEFDFLVSMVCTIVRFITFVMAIVVHRAFYRLMKRLPGRAVNQVIYPYMVSKNIIIKTTSTKGGMISERVDRLKKIFQKALFNYLILYRALIICKFSIIFYLQLQSIYSN